MLDNISDISNKAQSLPPSIMEYVNESKKQRQLHAKTLKVVILSQILAGAGLAAGVTVGALLAQDMLGTDRYAGVPSGLITLGSAAAAYGVGRLSQRWGRRLRTFYAVMVLTQIVMVAIMTMTPVHMQHHGTVWVQLVLSSAFMLPRCIYLP